MNGQIRLKVLLEITLYRYLPCNIDFFFLKLGENGTASELPANLLQLCLTLCGPMDWTEAHCSSVHGTLQAGILEEVALPSSG